MLPVNDPPVAVPDFATVDEDAVNHAIDVLVNDSDPDDALLIDSVTQGDEGGTVATDGAQVTYSPLADFDGTETFSYTLMDPSGETSTALVTVTVTNFNDPPVAVDDAYSVEQDTTDNLFPVLDNDNDPDDALLIQSIDIAIGDGTAVNNGTSISYTPPAGVIDERTFSYTLQDLSGENSTADVVVTITEINLPPIAADDSFSVDEDSSAAILDVFFNDNDPDDPLVVQSVTTPTEGGSASPDPTGVLYAPLAGFVGSETFSYTLEDTAGQMSTANVTVTVDNLNDLPTALDDSFSVLSETTVVLDVLLNDSDPDTPHGDVITITSAGPGDQGGTITHTASTISYTSATGFGATETFQYTIEDLSGPGSAQTATVTVNVFQTQPLPFIVAHRGGAAEAPENTLAAFQAALALGVSLDLDVRLSSDQVPVAIHDATVDRTTNGTGSVDSLTLAALQALDAGSHFDAAFAGEAVPTLEAVLQLFSSNAPPGVVLNVDLRVENATMYQEVVTLLTTYNLFSSVLLEVSDGAVADAISQLDSRARFSHWSPSGGVLDTTIGDGRYDRLYTLPPNSTRVGEAQGAGHEFLLRVNDDNDWVPAVFAGVDGALTDRPAWLASILNDVVLALDPPALASSALEEVPQTFTVRAAVLSGPAPQLMATLTALPGSPTFTPAGDGSGTFDWTPPAGSSSTTPHFATFDAVDAANASNTATLSVAILVDISSGVGSFLQEGAPNHLVSIEAESLFSSFPRDGHEWLPVTTPAGFSSNGAIQALPESSGNWKTTFAGLSPEVTFSVVFNTPGDHTVWVRGYGPTSGSNSLHVGLNGSQVAATTNFSIVVGIYEWTSRGPLNIPNSGEHTINVWARESGTIFDKIVLTPSAFVPTFDGPPESPRQGGTPTLNAPMIAPAGGTHVDTVTVTLSANVVDALLVYTLDGSAPTLSSPAFTGPFEVTQSATVTATAFVGSSPGPTGSEDFLITQGGNTLPLFDPIPLQTTREADPLAFSISASDPDGPPEPALFADLSSLPGNPTFTVQGGGSADFSWTPPSGDAGTYEIPVEAVDGVDPTIRTRLNVPVIVMPGPQPPDLIVPATLGFNEGDMVRFEVTASDPEGGGPPQLSVLGMPPRSRFVDDGDGNGSFTWITGVDDTGSYDLTFTATATGGLVRSQVVTVDVLVSNDLNFTRGTTTAKLFGVHEIVFTGDGSVTNAFDTEAQVTFVPPSGVANAVTVKAFYDGGNTWRARLYVSEVGAWTWTSNSLDDPGLHGQAGAFSSVTSNLPGRLRFHPHTKKQWIKERGEIFYNIAETSYKLFNTEIPFEAFEDYVEDDVFLGITSLRAGACGGYRGFAPSDTTLDGVYERTNWCWVDDDLERFNLEKFQSTDERMEWLFNNHPELYVQLILFGTNRFIGDHWFPIPVATREKMLAYQIARFSCWPQFFYLIVNDQRFLGRPQNEAMVREVGVYFRQNDPFQLLNSAGSRRNDPTPFVLQSDFDTWEDYLDDELFSEIDANIVDFYAEYPIHIYYSEDWYETPIVAPNPPADPDYYFRRMYWAVMLSGGSFAYGARHAVIHPYFQTGELEYPIQGRFYDQQLVGLDSVPFILPFFVDRSIDLAFFVADDPLAQDPNPPQPEGNTGPSRLQLMRRAYAEFLVYLPNPADGELSGGDKLSDESESRIAALVDPTRTPSAVLDLSRTPGVTYTVEWYRVTDGASVDGGTVLGGDVRLLTSPWVGSDAVLRVLTATGAGAVPTLSPLGNPSVVADQTLQVVVNGADTDGTLVSLSATDLPDGATFVDNGDNTGLLVWTPESGDVGDHDITLSAIDALDAQVGATLVVTITVTN